MTDNIFARKHALQAPAPGETTPILMEENPSRDYFFPVSGAEILQALANLPEPHWEGITHIWLRREQVGRVPVQERNLAEFICGSGVRLIVLYPWRRDLRLCLGRARPQPKKHRELDRFGAEVLQERGGWYARFTEEGLRAFYLQHLLLHEIGHHLDWYTRYWSKANQKASEAFADDYAIRWGSTLTTSSRGKSGSLEPSPSTRGRLS